MADALQYIDAAILEVDEFQFTRPDGAAVELVVTLPTSKATPLQFQKWCGITVPKRSACFFSRPRLFPARKRQ
jgi:hypothetical protein